MRTPVDTPDYGNLAVVAMDGGGTDGCDPARLVVFGLRSTLPDPLVFLFSLFLCPHSVCLLEDCLFFSLFGTVTDPRIAVWWLFGIWDWWSETALGDELEYKLEYWPPNPTTRTLAVCSPDTY